MATTCTIELEPNVARLGTAIRQHTEPSQSNQSRDIDVEPSSDSANITTAIPDGGYGWVVVFCCSLFTFHFNGMTGSWGVIQSHLLETSLSGVPTSTLTFVGSLLLALVVAFGLFSIRLMRSTGARIGAIIGITVLGLAEIMSGFTTSNIGGMFGTSGVLAGVGVCLLYSISNNLPAQYFSSKLGTANGLVKLGGGIGATVLAIALEASIQKLGIEWTFRILGFTTLATGLPAAWLIKERTSGRNAPFLELVMFKSQAYTAIFIASALATFTLFIPPYFLPPVARSVGLSSTTGAGLVAGYNACTAVGRLLSGPVCDKMGPTNTFLLTMALSTGSMLAIWPFSSNLGLLVVFAMLNGLSNGAFFVAMPTVVAKMFGPDRAAVAMGQLTTGSTLGYLVGPPIAGWLIKATGAETSESIDPYRPAIFYAGGLSLASSIFVLLARLSMDRKILKKV